MTHLGTNSPAERHAPSRNPSQSAITSTGDGGGGGEQPGESSAPPPLGSLDDDADSDRDTDDGPALPASQPTAAALGRTHSRGGGDVVLIVGLPDVFTVGYDALSFTARHFGGVRDVPAGPHFFWVAHPGGMAARSGFWVVSEGTNRVHAVRWDGGSELLVDARPDEIPADVDAFHAKLLPYRDPTARVVGSGGDGSVSGSVADVNEARAAENELIWGQLTSSITGDLLSHMTGQATAGGAGGAWHVDTMDHVQGEVLPSAEREMEQQIAHTRHAAPPPQPVRELHFALDRHAKTYSARRFGADRTREATDATSYLESLLHDGVTESSLVGELQFAFLAGVHLGNDACLEQWWHVVLRLLLKAYALPRRRPSLAAAWLRAVTAQLTYGGSWLDTPLAEQCEEARARELRLALIVYKRRLEEEEEEEEEVDNLQGNGTTTTTTRAEVAAAFSRLEAVVAADGYGWDIRGEYLRKGKVVMEDGEEVELEMKELQAEDERGEWAPEIVELDERGREKGLISWDD
ncbi:AAR2 protein [Cordyceps javanica]|uniref:AAR2 protein n=1 Tax=Cordyceps javanica TaxID=43265 RepID=A0A545UQW7_9HYPO|nr:AAR2 protein [Cordyceps javanica]TQW03801.1 AAR2 protein [Cordyceps javanica]